MTGGIARWFISLGGGGKPEDRVYDYVATPATLVSLVSGLSDGEIIALSDGTYTDLGLSYAASNAKIFALNPGSVIFNGDSRVFFTGTNSSLEGVTFSGSDGVYAVKFYGATDCTLRDSRFVNCGVDAYSYRPIVAFENGASGCIVENIQMEGNDAIGVGIDIDAGETIPTDNIIRDNYFKDVLTDSNKEVVQIGQGDRADETCGTLVERNIFENVDGDSEAISIKSSGNTVRDNLILDSDGYIVLREGDNNTVTGNCVSGCPVGIRVHGTGHTITSNLLVNNTIGISIPAGASTYTEGGGLHKAAENCDIDYNLIVSNTTLFDFDDWYDGGDYDTYPSSITLTNNLASKVTAQTLISAVQDVFTWTSNDFADLDWVVSSSPDVRFTLIDVDADYYNAANILYPSLGADEYESLAVTAYGSEVKTLLSPHVGLSWTP